MQKFLMNKPHTQIVSLMAVHAASLLPSSRMPDLKSSHSSHCSTLGGDVQFKGHGFRVLHGGAHMLKKSQVLIIQVWSSWKKVIHLPPWTRLLQGSLTKFLGKSPGSKLKRFPQMWHKGRRHWPAWLHSWVGPVVAQSHRSTVTTVGAAGSTWSFPKVKATGNTCNIVGAKGGTDQEQTHRIILDMFICGWHSIQLIYLHQSYILYQRETDFSSLML